MIDIEKALKLYENASEAISWTEVYGSAESVRRALKTIQNMQHEIIGFFNPRNRVDAQGCCFISRDLKALPVHSLPISDNSSYFVIRKKPLRVVLEETNDVTGIVYAPGTGKLFIDFPAKKEEGSVHLNMKIKEVK